MTSKHSSPWQIRTPVLNNPIRLNYLATDTGVANGLCGTHYKIS